MSHFLLLGNMIAVMWRQRSAATVDSRLLRVGATHSRLLVTLDVDVRMWMSLSMLEIVHLLAQFSVLLVHLTLLLFSDLTIEINDKEFSTFAQICLLKEELFLLLPQ